MLLFLGLGTGLGSALIVEGVVDTHGAGPPALTERRPYEDYVGSAGIKSGWARRNGSSMWSTWWPA